ncbi:MAG TPA: hypothetical protein VKL19_05715 [Thermoanaerobaculia bacterium]|nr:hypothetical protein [Thermoanaerobaculia bacterium]
MREGDRHRACIDDGPHAQRTLHHYDVRRQALDLFERSLSLDLGLHRCAREHRGWCGRFVALDLAGDLIKRFPDRFSLRGEEFGILVQAQLSDNVFQEGRAFEDDLAGVHRHVQVIFVLDENAIRIDPHAVITANFDRGRCLV